MAFQEFVMGHKMASPYPSFGSAHIPNLIPGMAIVKGSFQRVIFLAWNRQHRTVTHLGQNMELIPIQSVIAGCLESENIQCGSY